MRKLLILGVVAVLGYCAATCFGQQGLVDQSNERYGEFLTKWQDTSQDVIDSYSAAQYLKEYLEDELDANPGDAFLISRLAEVTLLQLDCEKVLKDFGLEFDATDETWVNIVPGGDPDVEADRVGLLWYLVQAQQYLDLVNADNNILTNWGRCIGMCTAGITGRGSTFASAFLLPDDEEGVRASWGRCYVQSEAIKYRLDQMTY